MKIGRLLFITILASMIFLLNACQDDERETLVQTTFTPSPTYTPRPSATQQPPASPTTNNPVTQLPTPTPNQQAGDRPSTQSTQSTPEPTFSTELLTPIPPTPAPSLTPFPAILLTPATPPSSTGYRLKPWTAEDADNLGHLMEAYHESMGRIFSGSITRYSYNLTAQPAAAAYREAQLRFPDHPLLPRWQLGDAINSAISARYPWGPDIFRPLLLDALNTGQLSPSESEIISWLAQYPSPFAAQFVELPPPPGYSGSYAVAIASSFGSGASTIWVLENEDTFTGQTLHSNLGAPFSSNYRLDVKSLTGPEAANLIITIGSHNGTSISADHLIYDLSQPEPVRLDFGPGYPSLFNVRHGIDFETAADGRDQIIILVDEADWCSLGLTAHYEWNGKWFEQVAVESQFWPDDSAKECLLSYLTFGFFAQGELERAANLAHYESRFDDVKPTGNNPLNGEPLEPDAQDEFRFYLALNHAVLRNVEQAQDYLQRIIDTPAIEDSRWIEPAETFLAAHHSAADLYPACQQATLDICPHDEALKTSVANQPPMDWPTLRSLIIEWGALIAANGSFDFDNDGEPEHWLALRHQPNEPLELWIFGEWDEGWTAVFVSQIDTIPQTFQLETIDAADLHQNPRYNKPAFDHTIFSIDGGPIYAFFRHPVHHQPYVRRLSYGYVPDPDPLGDQFDAIIESLWEGVDPAQVTNDLLTFASNPAFQSDAEYYYYLGLAYELSGDEQNAITAYLTAWRDHCCNTWEIFNEFTTANPYAIMAQAKLIHE